MQNAARLSARAPCTRRRLGRRALLSYSDATGAVGSVPRKSRKAASGGALQDIHRLGAGFVLVLRLAHPRAPHPERGRAVLQIPPPESHTIRVEQTRTAAMSHILQSL